jgi:hypothetical protein
MAVSIAGTVASKLLEQVMEATKIAISCNKCCKVLHALLKELQPILDHAVFIYYYHCFAMSERDWPITTKKI